MSKNTMKKETKVKQATHRYYCEACTGIAFLHVAGDELPKETQCKSCGHNLLVNKKNLIKL